MPKNDYQFIENKKYTKLRSVIDRFFDYPIGSIVKLTVYDPSYSWIMFCKVAQDSLDDVLVFLSMGRPWRRSIKLCTIKRGEDYLHCDNHHFGNQIYNYLFMTSDNRVDANNVFKTEIFSTVDTTQILVSSKCYFPTEEMTSNKDADGQDTYKWFRDTRHILEIDVYNYTKINIYKLSKKDFRNFKKFIRDLRIQWDKERIERRECRERNEPLPPLFGSTSLIINRPWVDKFIAHVDNKQIYRTIEVDHNSDEKIALPPFLIYY
jgi:hypothetical protein